MTRPDFSNLASTAAAVALAICSTTMLFAATYVPSATTVASSVA